MKKSSFKMVWLAFGIVILVELMRVVFGIEFVVTVTVEASIGSHEYALISFKFNTSTTSESRVKPTKLPVIVASHTNSPSRSILERQA